MGRGTDKAVQREGAYGLIADQLRYWECPSKNDSTMMVGICSRRLETQDTPAAQNNHSTGLSVGIFRAATSDRVVMPPTSNLGPTQGLNREPKSTAVAYSSRIKHLLVRPRSPGRRQEHGAKTPAHRRWRAAASTGEVGALAGAPDGVQILRGHDTIWKPSRLFSPRRTCALARSTDLISLSRQPSHNMTLCQVSTCTPHFMHFVGDMLTSFLEACAQAPKEEGPRFPSATPNAYW